MNHIQITSTINNALKTKKASNLSDDVISGLQLRVTITGASYWWVRKKLAGKTIQKKLGAYPELALKDARKLAEIFSNQLFTKDESFTVKEAFNAWYEKISKELITHKNIYLRCQKHIIKKFGSWQLKDLRAIDLIKHWEQLYENGHTETIHKLCSYIKKIAAFAINTGRVDNLHDLTKIRENYVFRHSINHAAVRSQDLKFIFKAFNLNSQLYNVSYSLLLVTCYTLLRIGEVVQLKWSYIDLENKVIKIPAHVMKMKRDHYVPISGQLENLLTSLPIMSDFIFPSRKDRDIHCNPETLRVYLKRIGLQSIQTAHGIRALGRTWMAEQGVEDYLAEICLHHKVGSTVQNIYKRYDYLEERRPIMQSWCDFVASEKQAALKISDDMYAAWYKTVKTI